jgi:hypothetical protein
MAPVIKLYPKLWSSFPRGLGGAPRHPALAKAWTSMSARAHATRLQIAGLADNDIAQLVIQLDQWQLQMNRLPDVTVVHGVHDPVELDAARPDLLAKFAVARTMLDELLAAGGSRWPVFKPGIERAWSEFEDALALLTEGVPGESEPVAAAPDESPEGAR